MVKPIHVYVGTKGEIIKMAPVMRELQARNIEYNFIHSGQHLPTTRALIEDFQLKQPDYIMDVRNKDVANFKQGLSAIIRNISKSIVKKKDIFKGKKGIVLLLGDTNTTIQGLWIAKLAGQQVAHIEAGERSHKILEPFPEEVIRRTVNRFANHNFALSEVGYNNLQKSGYKGKSYAIKYNTVLDSVRLALKSKPRMHIPEGRFVSATIHRFETIFSKEKLTRVVEILEKIAKSEKLVYVMHPSTKNRLVSYDLLKRLESNPNISIQPLYDYVSFMHLINKSHYIITDGGGPQEESAFMNKPCLLLRGVTERNWYEHMCVSDFKEEKIDYFLNNLDKFKRTKLEDPAYSPAKEIVDILEKL